MKHSKTSENVNSGSRPLLLASLVCAASLVAAGDVVYDYSSEDMTLTATVDANATNTFDFANYGSYLTDNLVTNFIKKGVGGLVGASDLGAYLGDITIEEGTYTFTTNRALGRLAGENVCGSVYVKDGATLDSHPPSTATGNTPWGFFNKRIFFEGTGVNGVGAIVHTGERTINRMVLSSNLVMTADATIANLSAYTMYMSGGSYPMWLDMNGHTLTFKGAVQVAWGCWNIKNPGKIISRLSQLTIQNANTYLNGSSANTLVITNNGVLTFNKTSGSLPWTLDARNALYISVSDGGANYNKTNISYWGGPVLLGDNRLRVALNRGYWFSFHGPISGNGGFRVESNDNTPGQLNLISPDSSFAGGVGMNRSTLALWNDGALPTDGGALAMTNSAVLFANDGVTYSLPDLQVHGTGLVSRGSGAWKTVTKTGDGALVWDSSVGADALNVRRGTVDFPYTRRSIAGFIESERTCYNGYAAVKAAWDKVFTNSVTLAPIAYTNKVHHLWSDPKDDGTDRYMIAYTGYIWNNEATNVTWSFAGGASTHLQVRLDGQSVFYFTGLSENSCVVRGTVSDVAPGPHAIDIRGYNTAAYGSFIGGNITTKKGQVLHWSDTSYAVGFDKYGRDSENQSDYEKLVDPGDGSLFTWTLPEHIVPNVTEEPGTARKVHYGVPEFGKMTFAAGTGLRSGYDCVTVPELEGLPTVTGVTNLLAVTTSWTIPAADFVGGTILTTPGRLELGPGATIVIEDDDRVARKSGEAVFAVATATGGITLPADLTVAGAAREWHLFLSPDAKTLNARHVPRGISICIR